MDEPRIGVYDGAVPPLNDAGKVLVVLLLLAASGDDESAGGPESGERASSVQSACMRCSASVARRAAVLTSELSKRMLAVTRTNSARRRTVAWPRILRVTRGEEDVIGAVWELMALLEPVVGGIIPNMLI